MRKVTHQTISEELSKTVLLPCLFTLRPGAGSSHEPPRIKWTKVWGQRGSDGLQKEQSVLVAKDNVVKVQLLFFKWYGSVVFLFRLYPLYLFLLTSIHPPSPSLFLSSLRLILPSLLSSLFHPSLHPCHHSCFLPSLLSSPRWRRPSRVV